LGTGISSISVKRKPKVGRQFVVLGGRGGGKLGIAKR